MIYDVVIVGGGAAGMAAAIYARRYDLKTVVLYETIGGHVSEAHKVENYPGFPSINGIELAEKFREHAEKLGAEIRLQKVERIEKDARGGFSIVSDVELCSAKTVLIATGTATKRLEIKGEKEFTGRGVSFCATCDAPLFRKKTVAIVGGGDSALSAALLLSDLASNVYLVHRRSEFRAEPILVKSVAKRKNVELVLESAIEEIKGEQFVKSIIVESAKGNAKREIALDGVFIEIGASPANVIVEGLGVKFDSEGFIAVDQAQATNVPGLYAAGDITTNSNKFRQIVTAASEGAIAANSIYMYLREHEKTDSKVDAEQWSEQQ